MSKTGYFLLSLAVATSALATALMLRTHGGPAASATGATDKAPRPLLRSTYSYRRPPALPTQLTLPVATRTSDDASDHDASDHGASDHGDDAAPTIGGWSLAPQFEGLLDDDDLVALAELMADNANADGLDEGWRRLYESELQVFEVIPLGDETAPPSDASHEPGRDVTSADRPLDFAALGFASEEDMAEAARQSYRQHRDAFD